MLNDKHQHPERFAIESRVGSGASGDIFRAKDMQTGATVAVKMLRKHADAADLARFEREINVLADLRHPNIVDYVAHGIWPDGRPYLAMEWLDGEDLAKVARRQPLGMRDAVEVVRRTAQALAAIHSRGIVHRDLKLSNIYVLASRRMAIKLIDFGVVKPSTHDNYKTEPGTILGTPHYMSPEQARGEAVDPRADVYSLGSVLFRLLTGRNVFQTDHVVALLGRLVLEDPPMPSSIRFDIPERLDQVVHRAISRDPVHRYPHAGDFARALARVGELHNDPPQTERSASKIRRRPQLASDSGTSAPGRSTYPALGVRRVVACLVYDLDLNVGESHVTVSDDLSEVVGDDVRIAVLAGGKTVGVLGVEHSRGDEVMRATRAALQILDQYPTGRAAVAMGHAIMAHSNLAGEALERAANQLDHAEQGQVRLGLFATGILEGHFEMATDDQGAVVDREILHDLNTRKLLGKLIPTVGRENEIAQLLGMYSQTTTDSYPRVAVITGPAGIGKSRVRSELIQRLELVNPPPEVLLCKGDHYSRSSTGSVLGRALRGQMGIVDGASPSEQVSLVRTFVRARLPRNLHFLGAFLGELVGVHFPEANDEPLRAARADQALLQSRIRMALEAYLRTRAGQRPLTIVIDDLHMCDELTLDLIDWVLACPDLRLTVFAFGAPHIDQRHPNLWQQARRMRLPMAPLNASASSQIACIALPHTPLLDRNKLVQRASGNPLILEELIRNTDGGSGALSLKIEALVQRRLDNLPTEVGDVVRAASVFGASFWPGGVARLLNRDITEHLGVAEQHELLTPQPSSRLNNETEWTFRQAVVRDAAHESLLTDDRRRFHLAAARWLMEAGCEDKGMIAMHFDEADEKQRASQLYTTAAQQALNRFGDLDNALDLATRGIGCNPAKEERAPLLLIRAHVLLVRGRLSEASEAADQAGALVMPASPLWVEAQRLFASALIASGQAADADVRLEWALGDSFSLQPEQRSVLLSARVRGLSDLGRSEQALEAANEAVGSAPAGRDDLMLRALDAQLFAYMHAGHAELGIETGETLIAAADRAGNLHLASRARINTASSLNYLGRYEDAQALVERALPDVRSFRLSILEASALHNIGMCFARRGLLDDGIEMQRKARAIADQSAANRLGINCRVYESLMLCWRGAPGDLRDAQQLAERALVDAQGTPPLIAIAHFATAFVQSTRRQFAEAHQAIEKSMAFVTTTAIEEWDEAIRLCHVEILLALGEHDRADEALRQAFEGVRKTVTEMRNPLSRNGFAERNTEVRRILSLAEQRLGRTL